MEVMMLFVGLVLLKEYPLQEHFFEGNTFERISFAGTFF